MNSKANNSRQFTFCVYYWTSICCKLTFANQSFGWVYHRHPKKTHNTSKRKRKFSAISFPFFLQLNREEDTMLAMSTLMMPAPTMACAQPIAVGPHKPPEAKLLAIHPAHNQTTPQHQIHAPLQSQQQQQQLSSNNKPGTAISFNSLIWNIKRTRVCEWRRGIWVFIHRNWLQSS